MKLKDYVYAFRYNHRKDWICLHNTSNLKDRYSVESLLLCLEQVTGKSILNYASQITGKKIKYKASNIGKIWIKTKSVEEYIKASISVLFNDSTFIQHELFASIITNTTLTDLIRREDVFSPQLHYCLQRAFHNAAISLSFELFKYYVDNMFFLLTEISEGPIESDQSNEYVSMPTTIHTVMFSQYTVDRTKKMYYLLHKDITVPILSFIDSDEERFLMKFQLHPKIRNDLAVMPKDFDCLDDSIVALLQRPWFYQSNAFQRIVNHFTFVQFIESNRWLQEDINTFFCDCEPECLQAYIKTNFYQMATKKRWIEFNEAKI